MGHLDGSRGRKFAFHRIAVRLDTQNSFALG